jgi:hypothetical protein
MQRFRRAGEIPLTGDSHEIAQVPQFHRHTSRVSSQPT